MSHPTNETISSAVGSDEEVPLQNPGGTRDNGDGDDNGNDSSGHGCQLSINQCLDSCSQRITSLWPCCHDREHRRLAIWSTICGLSCVGCTALIYSVKAQERRETDPEKAQLFSDKARCHAIVSIMLCLAIPVLVVVLVFGASYVLTLID